MASPSKTSPSELLASVKSTKQVSELMNLWQQARNQPDLNDTVLISFAKKALGMGDLILASEVFARAKLESDIDGAKHRRFPRSPELAQVEARALLEMRHLQQAREILLNLVDPDASHWSTYVERTDPDTLSLLGRTFKDEYFAFRDKPQNHSAAESSWIQAVHYYRRAYDENLKAVEKPEGEKRERRGAGWGDVYYPAVNLATLYLFHGDTDSAVAFAEKVEQACEHERKKESWNLASQAEAALIRGDLCRAEAMYSSFAEFEDKPSVRDLASARRQARRILRHLGHAPSRLDSIFKVPPLLVFAGHMIDPDSGNALPRFAPEGIDQVREELSALLSQEICAETGAICYCSAAAGSDLLFLDLVRRYGAEVHILLSSPPEQFKAESVTSRHPQALWSRLFDEAIQHAASITISSPHHPIESSITYDLAMRHMCGNALRRAEQLDLEIKVLSVCENSPVAMGKGGTADFLEFWHGCDQAEILPPIHPPYSPRSETNDYRRIEIPHPNPNSVQAIRSVLFADIAGFSKLQESDLPDYVRNFMGAVSQLIDWAAARSAAPITTNTWGDAIYMVFEHSLDAAEFALKLLETLSTDEVLPSGADGIRIALNTGTVFPIIDPITRQFTFTGRHVTLAARLEPITPANEIYATETYAALSAFEKGNPSQTNRWQGIHAQLVGTRKLAKEYGEQNVYRIYRSDPK